jgi:rSAM/selenodomain-associated transferase 2/rSAM/selenodomain-associated transferase 1
LIVFGRYPVPGKTKTRLIPALGPAGAADFQRRMTEKTLDTARAVASQRGTGLEFCYEGGGSRQIRKWLGPGLAHSPQQPGDLGARMQDAFTRAFRQGSRRVLLFGTDIPQLCPAHLQTALDALHKNDLVLGPSTDGGYWLMGLKRPENLFEGLAWGSPHVLEQTVSQAVQKGLHPYLMAPLTDVDTLDDLRSAETDTDLYRPYVSVIIPTLNEAEQIRSCLENAQSEDAEIIVVDGGSTDHTAERAAACGAKIEKTLRGRAVQMNRGAHVARGRVLLFLHADTLLPKGYVNHVFETLMDRKTALGAFRFKTDLRTPFLRFIEFTTLIRSRFMNLPFGDQGLFIVKALFQWVGGFPETPIAEDLLFVRKLSKNGKIRTIPIPALTSARRWRSAGLLRTMLINQLIILGIYTGVSPAKLASLYDTHHRGRCGS